MVVVEVEAPSQASVQDKGSLSLVTVMMVVVMGQRRTL